MARANVAKNTTTNKDIGQIRAHLNHYAVALGHNPLVNEPLTEQDWEEIWRAYVAFQHHLRLIVLKARKRQVK